MGDLRKGKGNLWFRTAEFTAMTTTESNTYRVFIFLSSMCGRGNTGGRPAAVSCHAHHHGRHHRCWPAWGSLLDSWSLFSSVVLWSSVDHTRGRSSVSHCWLCWWLWCRTLTLRSVHHHGQTFFWASSWVSVLQVGGQSAMQQESRTWHLRTRRPLTNYFFRHLQKLIVSAKRVLACPMVSTFVLVSCFFVAPDKQVARKWRDDDTCGHFFLQPTNSLSSLTIL